MTNTIRLQQKINTLKNKLMEKETQLKIKKEKENLKLFNQLKTEVPRLKIVIEKLNSYEKEKIKEFLTTNNFLKIKNIFFPKE